MQLVTILLERVSKNMTKTLQLQFYLICFFFYKQITTF